MKTIDSFTKRRIESAIYRLDELFSSGILDNPTDENSLFIESAFTEILILLRDLMCKSEKYSSRIAFTDAVLKTQHVSDISDLIKFMRDAICHRESDNHFLNKQKEWSISFCIIRGKGPLGKFGDCTLASEYEDDICFFYGKQRIYLVRHLIRAFHEAKNRLKPLL